MLEILLTLEQSDSKIYLCVYAQMNTIYSEENRIKIKGLE